MNRIWLVRHAQSKAQTGEDEDHINPPLSELGIRQAKRLTGPLGDTMFDRILISPLERAWRTYELSRAQSKRAEFDSRVMESNWGHDDFYAPVLPLSTPDIAEPDRQHAELRDVHERANSLAAELLGGVEQDVLLFGHWGIFGVLFRTLLGIDGKTPSVHAEMDNAAISLFEVDDGGRLILRFWNDRAHVADLPE